MSVGPKGGFGRPLGGQRRFSLIVQLKVVSGDSTKTGQAQNGGRQKNLT